jgi:hypothetical protein
MNMHKTVGLLDLEGRVKDVLANPMTDGQSIDLMRGVDRGIEHRWTRSERGGRVDNLHRQRSDHLEPTGACDRGRRHRPMKFSCVSLYSSGLSDDQKA